jgi:hypothetical protein
MDAIRTHTIGTLQHQSLTHIPYLEIEHQHSKGYLVSEGDYRDNLHDTKCR